MRKVISMLLLITLVVSLAGCAPQQTALQEPAWVITIDGVEGDSVEFTDLDVEKVGTVDITAVLQKSDGSETEQQWVGVALKQVLEYAGAGEFSTVVVEARDGYSREYTPEMVERDGTILGLKVDGKELEGDAAPVQLVVQGESAKWWIKNVVRIEVVK